MRNLLLAVSCAALLSVSTEAHATTTHTGVMKSITTDKSGAILDMYITQAGSTATHRLLGCGAKLEAQPLLVWAFQNKRLVYLTVDANKCFSNVIVKS